jgi:uncharacterized membrane protein
MLDDLYSNLELVVRWLHVLAGVLWIGHLYFFNFVNIPFQGTMEKDTKQKVNPQLLPRALFFFRWGAMITFLAGLVLFTMIYMYDATNGQWGPTSVFRDVDGITSRATWILLGGLFGTIMWFNVWFVIWPAQQKIIPAVKVGQAPDAALVKRATMASKINTYLSGPMLFGMLAANHYAHFGLVIFVVVVAVSLLVVAHAYKLSVKVSGF